MKCKIYGLVLFLFGLSFSAKSTAQVLSPVGVKTAVTISRFNISNFYNFSKWRTGFNIAVYGEQEFSTFLSLVPHVGYVQKGYISEQVETNETGERIQKVRANTRLDYLTIPLFLKIAYPNPQVTPFLSLGPRVDYLAHYKKGQFNFTSGSITDDIADHLSPVVWGASISCGGQIPMAHNHSLSIELQYNIDLTNSAMVPIQYNIKNEAIDFWIGLEL